MKYSIDLVRRIREAEHQTQTTRAKVFAVAVTCLAILGLTVAYSAQRITVMNRVLEQERRKLTRIETEYKQYKATEMTVAKSDIELLDKLQRERIYWTKKIAAMALHLPKDYWIVHFEHKRDAFKVDGYGYISHRQEQLVTIDDYLNRLRIDEQFKDPFERVFLTATKRTDEDNRRRVSFEYAALPKEEKK